MLLSPRLTAIERGASPFAVLWEVEAPYSRSSFAIAVWARYMAGIWSAFAEKDIDRR